MQTGRRGAFLQAVGRITTACVKRARHWVRVYHLLQQTWRVLSRWCSAACGCGWPRCMLEHGGQLRAAARYGIPLADWLDISTGINPVPFAPPSVPPEAWSRLPEEQDGLLASPDL